MTLPQRPPDDLLSRAEAAWRRKPVPQGPADDVTARILTSLRAASDQPAHLFSRRHRMRLTIPVAAAVFVALGGLLYFGSVMSGTRSVAWAQVVKKVNDARTLTYRSTIQTAGQETPTTGKFFFKVPGHIRLESSNGLTMIIDGHPDKQLFLRPATKTASFPNRREPKPGDVTGTVRARPQFIDQQPAGEGKVEFSGFDKLKNIASDKAEPLGKKSIGGVQAQGFRVHQNGETFTVWVDSKTSLPLVIEQKFDAGNTETTVTWNDFVFDPKLDDSLFSLDVPPGYELREE